LKAILDRSYPAEKASAILTKAKASQDAFFNVIVDERKFEFAGEAIRKVDLIRWNLLGSKMNQAHVILQELGVSDPSLDQLVRISQESGALGAKLTGGGRGGCMIALAKNAEDAQKIAQTLNQAGARQTWIQYLGEIND
jgi:mevalonate kinase